MLRILLGRGEHCTKHLTSERGVCVFYFREQTMAMSAYYTHWPVVQVFSNSCVCYIRRCIKIPCSQKALVSVDSLSLIPDNKTYVTVNKRISWNSIQLACQFFVISNKSIANLKSLSLIIFIISEAKTSESPMQTALRSGRPETAIPFQQRPPTPRQSKSVSPWLRGNNEPLLRKPGSFGHGCQW